MYESLLAREKEKAAAKAAAVPKSG